MMLTLIYPHGYIAKQTASYEMYMVTNDYIYIQTASKIFKEYNTYCSLALMTSSVTKTNIIIIIFRN